MVWQYSYGLWHKLSIEIIRAFKVGNRSYWLHFAGNYLFSQIIRYQVPDTAQALIHGADIAECVVALFAQPEKWGKVYELSGPKTLTQREQVEKIGQVLGVSLICHRVTPEQFTSSVSQYLSAEIIKMILTYWEETTVQPDTIRTGYMELTGKTGRSFEQWAEDHVGQFR